MALQNDTERTAATNASAFAARQKLSGREIARRLDLTPMYVARRLSGEVEFSESDLRRFAEVLDVPVIVLLSEATR